MTLLTVFMLQLCATAALSDDVGSCPALRALCAASWFGNVKQGHRDDKLVEILGVTRNVLKTTF